MAYLIMGSTSLQTKGYDPEGVSWPRLRRKTMADRKLKTWAEVKARRPLSAEAESANATWVEQQIGELNLQALRQ
jgi:hypothetical protein